MYHPISLSRPFSGNRQQHSSPAESGFTSDGGKNVVYATNRTTKPDGVPRVREWSKVERHVCERVLRGTMSQTTTRDPKHTCTKISTTEKVLSRRRYLRPDEILPFAHVYIQYACRQARKFVIANLYNWHGSATLAI